MTYIEDSPGYARLWKMKMNNKLARIARSLWPSSHRRYQEICVLAITGQLDGPEMSELDQHIAHCESCRLFLESTARTSVQAISMLADVRVPKAEIIPPAGMRARFLSRAAAEGLKIHRDASYLSSVPPQISFDMTTREMPTAESRVMKQSPGRFDLSAFTLRAMAVAAMIVMVGLTGHYGVRLLRSREGSARRAGNAGASRGGSATLFETGVENSGAEADRRKIDLESENRKLSEQLSDATVRKRALADDLSASVQQLADASAKAAEYQSRSNEEKLDAKNRISALQDEVDRLRWQLMDSKADLAAQQSQTEELKAKLERADSELQHELDLKSASPQIGELVAARNLHIIDVYDADRGERQHSFGRVFYVEGKSLVFYVYDLEDPHPLSTNVVFRVWGEKSGMTESTHSLGILHNDDASQGRWALTFDDAKVLAQINSVFVTVEPANRHSDKPRGKKVLYAYFGNIPNHP